MVTITENFFWKLCVLIFIDLFLCNCRTTNNLTRTFHCYPYSTYQDRYFLVIFYVIIKIFYIITIFFVHILLEHCLGFKYLYFSYSILNKIQTRNSNVIFSFLWFRLSIVLFISNFGLILTIYKFQPSQSSRFLGQHLEACNLFDVASSTVVISFIKKCPPNVILVLRLYGNELSETLLEKSSAIFSYCTKKYIFLFTIL